MRHSTPLALAAMLVACGPSLPAPRQPLSATPPSDFAAQPSAPVAQLDVPEPGTAALENGARFFATPVPGPGVAATLAVRRRPLPAHCDELALGLAWDALTTTVGRSSEATWRAWHDTGGYYLSLELSEQDPRKALHWLSETLQRSPGDKAIRGERDRALTRARAIPASPPMRNRALLLAWRRVQRLATPEKVLAIGPASAGACLNLLRDPSAMVVALAADVSAEDLLLWSTESFGALPVQRFEGSKPWSPLQRRSRMQVLLSPGKSAWIHALQQGPPAGTREHDAFALLAHSLTDGAMIREELRNRHSLTYGVSASVLPVGDSSALEARGQVDADGVGEAIVRLEAQLRILSQQGPPPLALARARSKWAARFVRSLQRPDSAATALARFAMHRQQVSPRAWLRWLRTVSPTQLAQTAGRWMVPENVHYVITGSRQYLDFDESHVLEVWRDWETDPRL